MWRSDVGNLLFRDAAQEVGTCRTLIPVLPSSSADVGQDPNRSDRTTERALSDSPPVERIVGEEARGQRAAQQRQRPRVIVEQTRTNRSVPDYPYAGPSSLDRRRGHHVSSNQRAPNAYRDPNDVRDEAHGQRGSERREHARTHNELSPF